MENMIYLAIGLMGISNVFCGVKSYNCAAVFAVISAMATLDIIITPPLPATIIIVFVVLTVVASSFTAIRARMLADTNTVSIGEVRIYAYSSGIFYLFALLTLFFICLLSDTPLSN